MNSEARQPVPAVTRGESAGARMSASERRSFQQLIRRETGIALSDSKHDLIASRISRRLRALGLTSFSDYYELVADRDPERTELRELIDCITTNKTSFFREIHHFEFLRHEVFPRVAERPPRRLRIWSAACSSGEEPYSIAMTLREELGQQADRHQILASDISAKVLREAELAVYDESQVADLSRRQLERGFLRGRGRWIGTYRVRPELRSMVRFERINLNEASWQIEPGIDLLFCRNALIYFDREAQDGMLRRFADLLSPDGYLFLGHSENLTWLADLYERVGQTVYRVRSAVAQARQAPAKARTSREQHTAAGTREVAPALPHRRIALGEMAASATASEISTVLGSCVAACLFDPEARVGGMNHFLLPDGDAAMQMPSRYGVHAMELLINEIMQQGGDRRRLVGKAFGGAHSPSLGEAGRRVAESNAAFVRRFLQVEGIPLLAERLGGQQPLEVRFETQSGRARVRALARAAFLEASRPTPPAPPRGEGDVTLF